MACLSGGPDRKGGRWLASRELSQSSRGADGASQSTMANQMGKSKGRLGEDEIAKGRR